MSRIGRCISKYISRSDVVLDLCCGDGRVTADIPCKHMIAVDIYLPYAKAYKKRRKDALILVQDIRSIPATFQMPVDVVMCVDGLEHLEKEDAIRVLDWGTRAAKKKIIIFTPDRFTENRPKDTWGIPGGDRFQEHRCFLGPKEFEARGFKLVYQKEKKNVYSGRPYREMLYVLSK